MIIDCHAHVSAPAKLWAYKATLLAHRGSHGRGKVVISDDEMIEEYLLKYLNGPKAATYAAFKTGAVIIEGMEAFFIYNSFFDSLKNKEWKESKGLTAERLTRLFKAEFGIGKRFPKKSGDKTSHSPVSVVKVSLDKFPDLLEDKHQPEQVIKNNVEQSNF